jgi:hypothetical protein
MQFHPEDIPKGDVRQIYSDVCEELFADELDIKQFTIAYSRPTTIGSVVAKSKLFQDWLGPLMSDDVLRAAGGSWRR